VIDEWVTVSDKDAMLMTRRLAREEGLFCGGSTGVNIVSALEMARRVDDPEALLVTVLCDTGERYLSKVYNDEWLRENEILESERVTVAHLLVAKNGTAAPPLVSVAPSATVRQALNLMSTYNVSQLPVLDGGDGVGAVFEQVLMTKALEDHSLLDQPVELVRVRVFQRQRLHVFGLFALPDLPPAEQVPAVIGRHPVQPRRE